MTSALMAHRPIEELDVEHACAVVKKLRLNVPALQGTEIESFFVNNLNPKPGDLMVYGEKVLEGVQLNLPSTPVLVECGEIAHAHADKKGCIDGHQVLRELPENPELDLATIVSMISNDLLDPKGDERQNVFYPKELPKMMMSYRKECRTKDCESIWHGVFFWSKNESVIDKNARVFYAAPAPF